jgi:predicted DCC family thiol-disulfide oxidoreductase YuxK
MCRRSLGLLRLLDLFRVIVPYDVANDWETVAKVFPHIDAGQAMRDMHVVTSDGATYKGFDGWRNLAWALPLLWIILPLLYLPPIPWMGRKVYRRIADNRCTTGCRIPQTTETQRPGAA